MTKKHHNYIAGSWVTGEEYSNNINPSDTDDIVGAFALGSVSDVAEAVEAARSAFASWSRSGILQRAGLLSKVARTIHDRKEELGRLLSREEGKTLAEGVGETVRAAQVFDFFAGECLRLVGEKLPSVRPGVDVEVTREPIGVVGIITPWNFPIAIPAWKIAPALAYGNCVVFKPANLTPACAHALTEIIVEAGAPPGVFNLVMGRGREVGEEILTNPGIDAVTFTGSVETGRHVASRCVEQMKKFQLEMGGKNPLVVMNDADLHIAVECAINGAFFSTGQRCTASSRLIVEDGIYEKFLSAIRTRMNELVVGNALDKGVDIGPLVDQTQLEKTLKYIDIGKSEGADLVCGGEALTLETPGFYFAPALFSNFSETMRVATEEIFGPVAVIQRAEDYEHAVALANETKFGLSAGICTTSLAHATSFKRDSQAGMVMVNLPTAGVDFHVPFGGRKGSSYGSREQGRYAAEFYTVVKTAYSTS